MAAALAHSPHPVPPRPGPGVAPAALRAVGAARGHDDLDLDAAWVDATAPHRVAAQQDVRIEDVAAPGRVRAVSPRVRRNRLTAVLFVVALAVVLAVGAGGLAADADGPTTISQTVTVQPGQTLWDVAVAHTADGADPRTTLETIRDLNGLTGTDVPAWTAVVLPTSLD